MTITHTTSALFWNQGILISAEAYHRPFSPACQSSETAAENSANGADDAVRAECCRNAGVVTMPFTIQK